MLSAWQIVSLDYSEWIDAVGYADLDGKDWNLYNEIFGVWTF